MLDAKRLAELMTPEKLRVLANYLDNREGVGVHVCRQRDKLEEAAAVLRELAGRATDKVIEIDLDDPAECRFCQYEQGMCMVDDPDSAFEGRSCVGDSRKRGPTDDVFKSADGLVEAPPWCPARGRFIVQAKAAAAEKRKG